MNKKRKTGALLLITGILGASTQTITSNLASAVQIKEIFNGPTTPEKTNSSSGFWRTLKRGLIGVLGALFGCYELRFLTKIRDISKGELDGFKLKIERFANKKTSLDNKQGIYVESDSDNTQLKIGVETKGDNLSRLYGPTLTIDRSLPYKPKVIFQVYGVDSKGKEIESYQELCQKLGLILRKIDKNFWATLDLHSSRRLIDIEITDNAGPFVDGHPVQRIIKFLTVHKHIMNGTRLIGHYSRNFSRFKINSGSLCSIIYNNGYGDRIENSYTNEKDVIGRINELLSTKNLEGDYRLKLRVDNVGNYKLSLYKGKPSEDTYVGDVEDEEDVKILKNHEVPYVADRENKDITRLLVAYMEEYPENKKMRDDVYNRFYYGDGNLFLDETSHVDSNGKPESRLYFITDYDGTREYVFEPEDIKDDEDAQKIRKTIINTIKRKYEK